MSYTWSGNHLIGQHEGTDHGADERIPKEEIAGADRR